MPERRKEKTSNENGIQYGQHHMLMAARVIKAQVPGVSFVCMGLKPVPAVRPGGRGRRHTGRMV